MAIGAAMAVILTTGTLIAPAPPGVRAQSPAVATVTCVPVAATAPAPTPLLANFAAVTPRRIVDTRDGTGGVTGPLGAGCTLRIDLDAAAVPAAAEAVALSLTAIAPDAGFLTVFPCAAGRPATSNLNTRPGFPTPNLVVGLPDAQREICIFSSGRANVLVDVTGSWSEDGDQRFASITPVRAFDSRAGGGDRIPADTVREIDVGTVVPAGTSAIVANLTVAGPVANGFLVAYPCGGTAPLASNLNFRGRESRAVAAVVGVAGGRRLCVRTSVDAHVIVDIAGYYGPAPQWGPAAALSPVAGTRLADSRDPAAPWTSRFGAGTVRRLTPVTGGVRDQATAVVLNLVAIRPDTTGYVTVYPCDRPRPTVSSLNYAPTTAQSANMVTVEISADAEICVFTLTPVDLVVDLFGVLVAPAGSLAERLGFDEHTWPPFDPTATDYAVECGAAAATVRLTIDRLVGVGARVNGVPVAAREIDLVVAPDDLTTVRLSRGPTTREYAFRCVPADFPRLEVERPGDPSPGWYLTNLTDDDSGAQFVAILDEHGAPVWYRRAERLLIDVRGRSDGRLLATATTGLGFGIDPARGYRVYSLSGVLVDELTTVDPTDFPTDHHDYVELPSGGRSLLSYPLLRNQNLSTIPGGAYGPGRTIADGVVQEIGADGGLDWSWRVSDHFEYAEVTFAREFANFPTEPGGSEVDVWHLNSLERVDDGSGDYVLSARHLDAVFRVDRVSGGVDWILGGSGGANDARRLTVLGDPLGGPKRPHDARLDGDVLTVFDNRTATGQPARAVAYRIDATAGTATLLWEIREPGGSTSGSLGSNRVAGDGSVLVNWGDPIQPMFTEYGSSREVLMTIAQVGGGRAYRVVKEPTSTFSRVVLRANAGGALEAP